MKRIPLLGGVLAATVLAGGGAALGSALAGPGAAGGPYGVPPTATSAPAAPQIGSAALAPGTALVDGAGIDDDPPGTAAGPAASSGAGNGY